MNNNQGHKLSIFVSSTCYDLKYVREILRQLISKELGYESILSEYDSFPINPSLDTVENCLRNVREKADIFVLIIGGRYGYETENGKSITNLEYLQAKSKGIPIYVFTEKNVLNALPLWKDNPKGNFKSVVETTKVFDFVNEIRELHKGWVYEFEKIEDITNTLKKQFSFLFADSLKTYLKLNSLHLSERLQQLDSRSLKIVIEEPDLWEFLLFGSILTHNIIKFENLKSDYENNLYFGDCIIIDDIQQLLEIISHKFSEIGRLVDMLSRLINVKINEAIGEEGVPGDAEKIVYVADSIARVYRAIIEWGIKFDSIIVEDCEFENLIKYTRSIADGAIKDFNDYISTYDNKIKDGIQKRLIQNDDDFVRVDLTLKLRTFDEEAFSQEMSRLTTLYLVEDLVDI